MTAIAEIIETLMWLLLAAYGSVKIWKYCIRSKRH
jgi:hypothetical protein